MIVIQSSRAMFSFVFSVKLTGKKKNYNIKQQTDKIHDNMNIWTTTAIDEGRLFWAARTLKISITFHFNYSFFVQFASLCYKHIFSLCIFSSEFAASFLFEY